MYLYLRLLVDRRVVEAHDEGEPGAQESVDGEFSYGLPIKVNVLEVVGVEQFEFRIDSYLFGESPIEFRLDDVAGEPFVALGAVEAYFWMVHLRAWQKEYEFVTPWIDPHCRVFAVLVV